MTPTDEALLSLLRLLKQQDYRFVTPTPATHARVIARPDRKRARSLEDILGWSLPFEPSVIDPQIMEYLDEAEALMKTDGMLHSLVRVSSLGDCLYVHSAFPTDDQDAVFFGPDSYRFADLIKAEIADHTLGSGKRVVDVGSGAGVGAIVIGRLLPHASVAMTEINAAALRFARINAAAANVSATAHHGNCIEGIEGTIDIALANPPYLIDAQQRLYRDGGAFHGGQISCDMAEAILPRLNRAGRFILYSGSAIICGTDALKDRLNALAEKHHCTLRYRELDPDVFGEELADLAYAEVDRIALIAAIFERG